MWVVGVVAGERCGSLAWWRASCQSIEVACAFRRRTLGDHGRLSVARSEAAKKPPWSSRVLDQAPCLLLSFLKRSAVPKPRPLCM
eukprot:354138-Chlamydomonas_euryale.AAC.2